MKKYLAIALVIFTWIVYLKNGDMYFAKKVDTGRFNWVTITLTDLGGTKVLIPREQILKIEEDKD